MALEACPKDQKGGNMSEMLFALVAGLLCIGAALLVLIGAIALLYFNHKGSRKMAAVRPNWPSLPAHITAARVEETVRIRADEDAFFSPIIEFEYTVAGQIYTGRQAVGRPSNLDALAKRALGQYPPGTEVLVTYNPEKPEQARLLTK
jgi:hypothetical protein